MSKEYTASSLAVRIWFTTSAVLAAGITIYQSGFVPSVFIFFLAFAASLIGSLPVLIVLLAAIPAIKRNREGFYKKVTALLFIELTCIAAYGIVAWFIVFSGSFTFMLITIGSLSGSAVISTAIFSKHIIALFNGINHSTNKNDITMETNSGYVPQSQSNRNLIKGLVAGGLILLMLIPTIIIKNLISEREARQKEVVKEVSAKWALAQTVYGPFLSIPYLESTYNSAGQPVFVKKQLTVLSKNLNVDGKMIPENRPRSIYKVLLYKSNLNLKGSFQPDWPADISLATLDFTNARICFGLSDFKGIEEEIFIKFNDQRLALSPGLPSEDIIETGLSAPVTITQESLKAGISYEMNIKLKGSERLHFMPLAANSSFALNSTWPDPSFDGNSLPIEKSVNDKGFSARWNYNQANLPYGMVIKQGSFVKQDMSFGVSMVQPDDQYNKTMRSVKYAILIIGLTFALFFIIELMQGKPFHPVQYVLVGLALVIFYTLLLSISEFILFDHAYLIATVSTVCLITLYAKSHFQSWKTASVFGSALTFLYGFIFILLRLEDTALLVGSIGLFTVLAVVMYVSRKVDWYGSKPLQPVVSPS